MAEKPALLAALSVGKICRPMAGVWRFFAQMRGLWSQPPCGGR
jgi:hypothetical protein